MAAASALVMLLARVATGQAMTAAAAAVVAAAPSSAAVTVASAEDHDPNIVLDAAESGFLRSIDLSVDARSSLDRGSLRAV